MSKKMMSDFGGVSFTEYLRVNQDRKEQVSKYFHFDSLLWKAIRQHIEDEGTNNALIDWPPEYLIVIHRGTGAAFSSPRVFLYDKNYDVRPSVEQDVYSLDFDITFVHEDDRHSEYPPEHRKSYSISPPLALEEHFTPEGFEAWIAQCRKAKEAKTVKEWAAKLAELKKNPSLWRKINRAAK